mgnify:CR=1 FL=1
MNRKTKVGLLILLLFVALRASAQEGQALNVGLRAGFSSSIYSVEKLSIENHPIIDFTTKSEVSVHYATFLRVNMHRHYLQTEVAYSISRYSVLFPTSSWSDFTKPSDVSTISTKLTGIEVPIYYGYHIRQENVYGMSFFMGPKLSIVLPELSSHVFENFTQASIAETISRYNYSAVVGMGVNIGMLSFDVAFEAGLNNISRYFTTTDSKGNISTNDFIFDRRKNGISFSVGLMF